VVNLTKSIDSKVEKKESKTKDPKVKLVKKLKQELTDIVNAIKEVKKPKKTQKQKTEELKNPLPQIFKQNKENLFYNEIMAYQQQEAYAQAGAKYKDHYKPESVPYQGPGFDFEELKEIMFNQRMIAMGVTRDDKMTPDQKEKYKSYKVEQQNFILNLQKTEFLKTPSNLEKSILDEAAINLLQILPTVDKR